MITNLSYAKYAAMSGSTAVTAAGIARHLRRHGWPQVPPVAVTVRQRELTSLASSLRRGVAPTSVSLSGHGAGARFCGIDLGGIDLGLAPKRLSKCHSCTKTPSVCTRATSVVTGDRGWRDRASTLHEAMYVPSFACVRGTRCWVYRDGALVASLTLPRDLRWSHDALGLRAGMASGIGAMYHPTASELLSGQRSCMAAIHSGRARIAAGVRAEKVAKKIKEYHEAELKNVAITLQDSIAAGNCEAGTIAYARQRGINIDYVRAGCPIPVSALGSDERVTRAARIAYARETMVSI